MTRKEILAELEKMTDTERLEVIEMATRLVRNGLGNPTKATPAGAKDSELVRAAEMMRSEYESNAELTAFTSLDAEDFHDA